MLDTEALRLDICALIRVARTTRSRRVRWTGRLIEFSELDEVLVFHDDDLEVDLVRVRVPVPGLEKAARGPVLALCPRGCGARARILWADPYGEFFPVCRRCGQIEYATAHGTELGRAELAYDRLRQRYGLSKYATHEPRPHQHRSSYLREAARLENARTRVAAARTAAVRRWSIR